MVVRKGSTFKLVKYDDLKGRQGVAIKDVTYGDGPFANLVNTSPDMRYTMNIADAFVELKSGAVDYVLGYEYNVLAEMSIKNTFEEFEFVDTVPFALSEYAAFSKKSKCAEQLTKQFGKMISETRSRYDYYALQSKYKQLFTMSMADRVKWEHIQRVFELCERNVSETARVRVTCVVLGRFWDAFCSC